MSLFTLRDIFLWAIFLQTRQDQSVCSAWSPTDALYPGLSTSILHPLSPPHLPSAGENPKLLRPPFTSEDGSLVVHSTHNQNNHSNHTSLPLYHGAPHKNNFPVLFRVSQLSGDPCYPSEEHITTCFQSFHEGKYLPPLPHLITPRPNLRPPWQAESGSTEPSYSYIPLRWGPAHRTECTLLPGVQSLPYWRWHSLRSHQHGQELVAIA